MKVPFSSVAANRVFYTTALDTVGTSADFTFDGSTLSAPSISTTALVSDGDTWANVSATTPTVGAIRYVTNIGPSGSHWTYRNSRWAALNGKILLANLSAAVSGITNSETVVLQALIPIGAMRAGDVLRAETTGTKSGSTDNGNLSVRIGTAGTTADTAIRTLTVMSAANLTYGGVREVVLVSNTTAQPVGPASGGISAGSFGGGSNTAVTAPIAITDASANALYVSVTIAASSTNNTVAITSGQLWLITP